MKRCFTHPIAVVFWVLMVCVAFVVLTVPTPTPTVVGSPDVVMEVLDPSLRPYERLWQAEIGRRFHNAVGIMCHGGNHLDGTWDTSATNFNHVATLQQVVAMEQARYPNRTLIVIACNPGHLKLGISNVYYAPDNIWLEPDRDAMGEEDAAIRAVAYPNYVGSIFEFVKD